MVDNRIIDISKGVVITKEDKDYYKYLTAIKTPKNVEEFIKHESLSNEDNKITDTSNLFSIVSWIAMILFIVLYVVLKK